MTRWLVTYDDAVTVADTPLGAVEARLDADSIPFGATVFAIDLDAIEGTDRCIRIRVGAYEVVGES